VLGRLLFRWRGAIGVLAFGFVFWLARPTPAACLFGVPSLLVGLAVRFWASGYIGIEGRAGEIGAKQRIVSGPYRLLRHPLYIGNSLLVTGMLVALRPAVWVAGVVLVGFVVEYALIVAAEEKDLLGRRSQMSDVRSEMSEVRYGEGGEATSEVREARGIGFSLSRATCEWRTWVVTGVAWGGAILKAVVSS
jgi:protein-S-isoprenylcysteine O-methyltransferase Ste14